MTPGSVSRWKNRLAQYSLMAIFVFCTPAAQCNDNLASEKYQPNGFTVAEDKTLRLNGKPYRGIGVNYFNAFYRTLLDPSDRSYRDGLQFLRKKNIPFIRFSISGFWPDEFRLYLRDKEAYFLLLDEFVDTAQREGIGLVPSLFWNHVTISDLMGEPVQEWGNPKSKTIEFMRTFTREVVERYRKSPAILAWEFGNEMNAYADLAEWSFRYRPAVKPSSGTPASRSAADDMTTDVIRNAMQQFSSVVRQYDGDRIILSGNDIPPPNAANRYRLQRWKNDLPDQYMEMLSLQNPDPVNTISIHLYPHRASMRYGGKSAGLEEILRWSMAASRKSGKPLFIGEFGSPASLGRKKERQIFSELLSAIEREEVPLSALWVFDYAAQEGEWNVARSGERKYQIEEISRVNLKIQNGVKF